MFWNAGLAMQRFNMQKGFFFGMKLGRAAIAGALLLIGAAQFLICMIIAEATYPGYSVSANMISDLGVGQTALLFNAPIIAFGLLAIACVFLAKSLLGNRVFSALLALAGVGIAGVGLFPETTGLPHVAFAFTAFLCGSLAAIASAQKQGAPAKWVSVALGIASLLALALLLSQNYLGLGGGGMERMVVYPILVWAIAFGAWLAAKGENGPKED
jgi:hypothetical membrane protein